MDLHDGDQRGIEIIVLWLLGVENLDGECSTRNGEDRAPVEIPGELFGVKGSRGDDDLQVGSSLDRFCEGSGRSAIPLWDLKSNPALTFQETEQHVSRDGTLVRLVQHDDRILRHVRVY